MTIMPPWGQYSSAQLVNLGYNRWAVKPEIGVTRTIRRWTLEAAAGVWLFTTTAPTIRAGCGRNRIRWSRSRAT